MVRVRGFKGRYFTLAAIQAHSGAAGLHARECAFVSLAVVYTALIEEEEDDPPEEPLLCPCALKESRDRSKPCHCNCHFRRVAWLLFHLSKFFRRTLCRCRKTKTGLAPPSSAY
ncbi:hypothetical protein [Hydrogenimonas sp.]